MARQLLGIADSGESEAVRLAAIKDALDRSGIQAKTAVSVEVSTKLFEMVFDAIVAGPRGEPPALAIEDGVLGDDTDQLAAETVDDEIVGEFDDDPPDDDESDVLDVEIEVVLDVEIEVVDAGYTDAGMSQSPGALTPDDGHESLSGAHSPPYPVLSVSPVQRVLGSCRYPRPWPFSTR